MSSTFGGLNTAASGLYAAQRGIDVTGQNVSNVNTAGYSRQRVDLKSVGASAVPAFWSGTTGVGSGVDDSQVTRITDSFLQGRAQTTHATAQQLSTQNDALTQIQQSFGEPGDSGIQSQLSAMWTAWQDLANNPSQTASGSAVLQSTQTVVDGMHQTRSALDTQWSASRTSLDSLVAGVNSTASDIASLNEQIQLATASGQSVNELMDQRDADVQSLAEQIGATGSTAPDGTVTVAIGGVTLVNGATTTTLAVAGPTSEDNTTTAPVPTNDPAFMTIGLPRIVTANGHTPVAAGGTAGGTLDTLNDLIPTYRGQLDAVAANLAAKVNAQQAAGYDTTGTAGGPLLAASGGGAVTAANISLATTDPTKLATSSLAPDGTGAAVDGGNADAMSQLGTSLTGPDATYRSMITAMGVQASSVSSHLAVQTTLASSVDTDVQSVSGVDIDEEMTNMLSYQHAYSAAAKLISVIDQNLDTLINMVGA